MDERLDYYSSDEMLRTVSTPWISGHGGSTETLDQDSSKLYLQYKNCHLHLIEKKEVECNRIKIPATKMQRLSYYGQYVTTIAKTQLVSLQTGSFNMTFWNYFLHVILKSMPHTYVIIFLASYAPDQHLFVPKMIPFFYGYKFTFLLTSCVEILRSIRFVSLLFGTLYNGVVYKSPWNRCVTEVFDTDNDSMILCYTFEQFTEIAQNQTLIFGDIGYKTEDGFTIQISQIIHLIYYAFVDQWITVYLIIVMMPLLFSHKLVIKTYFWKILHAVQWTVISIEVILYFYLIYLYYEGKTKQIEKQDTVMAQMITRANIHMLSESVAAPPVLHVLTARSTQEINPHNDSAAIIVSNALLFIFRGLLTTRLQNYCEGLAGIAIQLSVVNPLAWFYLWPIFFSKFHLGNLYLIIFLAFYSMVECMVLIVTYYCMAETIIYEWKWVRRWMIALTIIGCYLIANKVMDSTVYLLLYVFSKGIFQLFELLIIYYVYPVERLVDDITFHTGSSPTLLRVILMKWMPFFYLGKVYAMIYYMALILSMLDESENYINYIWIFLIPLVPLVLGMLFVIYKYIFKDHMSWDRMFAPVSDWGPHDHSTRQMRKLYDSRHYIGSQALRSLSRYMYSKSASKAFKLDLNYTPQRRSTIPTSMFRMETEKKEN